MDTDKIFSLFKVSGEEEAYNELEKYKKHPLYIIGMFKKLISNYYSSRKNLILFFNKIDSELSKDDLDRAGEFIVLNKAYDYISQINVNNRTHQESLFFSLKDPMLKENIILSISYFEKYEEYEKCKVLKEILDFLNLF